MTDKQIQIKKAYDLIKSELATIYQNNWTYADFMKLSRVEKFDTKIQKILESLFKEHQAIIEGELSFAYTNSATSEIGSLATQGLQLKGIQKSLDVVAAIKQPMDGVVWYDRLGRNRGEVLYKLSSEIKSGIYNGLPYSKVTKTLKDVFGSDLIMNDTIARTETKRVISLGQTDVLDKVPEGVDLIKTWRTMKDSRVRSGSKRSKGNHVMMNGKTIPYAEDFVTPSGSRGKAPMQMKGLNAKRDNINCRCIMTVSIK